LPAADVTGSYLLLSTVYQFFILKMRSGLLFYAYQKQEVCAFAEANAATPGGVPAAGVAKS